MPRLLSAVILSLLFLVFAFQPAFAALQAEFGSALYFRYSDSSDMDPGFDLPGIELNPRFTLSGDAGDLLTLAFQIFTNGTMHGTMKDLHYGNAYLIIPTGLDKPTIKLGQQVLPFGQLAEYDTHAQIIQNLYAKTIGLRIDTGISLYGLAGAYDYWLMISNGNGPNRADSDNNKLITARIARKFILGSSDLKVGFSGLRGNLPYFKPGHDAIQAMHAARASDYFEAKTLVALDAELSFGPFLFRGELVTGRNKLHHIPTGSVTEGNAMGYYTEVRYALSDSLELIGKYDSWKPYDHRQERVTSNALGLNYSINKNVELQLAAERFDNHNIADAPKHRESYTLQVSVYF